MCPMLVNKTSHKFTGKLGQKVDKTKCGHNYKIILDRKQNLLECYTGSKTRFPEP